MTSTSSNPIPFPHPQAAPLPTKRGEIGYPASRSNSSASTSSSRSFRTLRFGERSRLESNVSAISGDLEGRLDGRLNGRGSGNSNGSGSGNSNGGGSSSSGNPSSSIPTSPRGLSRLLRPLRLPSLLPSTAFGTSSLQSGSPPSKLQHIVPALVLWLIAILVMVGTGIGYAIALRVNQRAVDMAKAYEQMSGNSTSTDNVNSTISGGGVNSTSTSNSTDSQVFDDQDSSGNDTLFLNSLFILAFIFEVTFLYRLSRRLYVAIFFDYSAPAQELDPTNPKPKTAKSTIKRLAEWFLRIPEEKLRPKEEELPSYLNALGVPGAGREVMAGLTREERRLRRIGSTRGTGDVEDIEVERAWRIGGGNPLPVYNGDQFRDSQILLSGPALSRTEQNSEGEGGSTVERLSRRVSETAMEVIRRISGVWGGSMPGTPTVTITSEASTSTSAPKHLSIVVPSSNSKLSVPHSPSGSPTPSPITPVRLAHHASVVLDMEAVEEKKMTEKESLESGSSTSDDGKGWKRDSKIVGGSKRRESWLAGIGIGWGTRRNSNAMMVDAPFDQSNPSTSSRRSVSIPINSSSIVVEIPENMSEDDTVLAASLQTRSTSSSPRTPQSGTFAKFQGQGQRAFSNDRGGTGGMARVEGGLESVREGEGEDEERY